MSLTETYANNYSTTLSGSITSGATSLVVASTAGEPLAPQFRSLIDSELILTTAMAGTTWTITRGIEGTTAAAHSSGATITHILTSGGLVGVAGSVNLTDVYANIPTAGVVGKLFLPSTGGYILRDSGTSWAPWGPIYQMTTPLPLSGTAATTLAGNGGSITNVATSIKVASSTGFPATPFIAQIESEDVKVTNVSSLTWTVVRGYNGTSNVSHNDGVAVVQINWEWVNQGGATLSTSGGYHCMYAPTTSASHNLRILKNVAPATPYTVTMYIDGLVSSDESTRFGILFRESSTGKLATYEYSADNPTTLRSVFYNNATSPISAAGSIKVPMLYSWLRIRDDGTNRTYWFSRDGQIWVQQFSESRTNNLTADEYGWFIDPINTGGSGTNIDSLACLYSVKIS